MFQLKVLVDFGLVVKLLSVSRKVQIINRFLGFLKMYLSEFIRSKEMTVNSVYTLVILAH